METKIQHMDALALLAELETDSIDLIATDPPYYQVKQDDWDNQWPNEQSFLDWLESVIRECARALKPCGSLYLFASAKMAAKVELRIGRHLDMKNHITWFKEKGLHQKVCKAKQRSYFPASERILFAIGDHPERKAQDRAYANACAPLIDYFRQALAVAELTQSEVDKQLDKKMAGHWFGRSQWRLPPPADYQRLQACLKGHLSRNYESLLAQREQLLEAANSPTRRPFELNDRNFNTDVWHCPPVQYYPGKHPCEKPQAIMQHIIATSSRPGDRVLDPFTGGGSTALASRILERNFIGSELNPDYVNAARARITE